MTPTERTSLLPPDARVDATSASATVKMHRRQRFLILTLAMLIFILIGAWGLSVHRSSNSAHDGEAMASSDVTAPSAHAATRQEPLVFVCDDTKQDAGYIKLPNKKKDDRYFYWFFKSRRIPASDPLVVWLQGGPGCSSLAGLLT